MKFELIGDVKLWVTVHTDGYSEDCKVREHFSAPNKDVAISHAKLLMEMWPKKCSRADAEFQEAKAELRVVDPFWRGELKPEKTTVLKKVPATKFKLKESPKCYVGF